MSYSISQAVNFASALWAAGVPATLEVDPSGTHTSLVLEDPLSGVSTLLAAVLDAVAADEVADGGHGDRHVISPRSIHSPPQPIHLSRWWALAVRAANPF